MPPVHGVQWSMCMGTATMALHQFEQAMVQEAESLSTFLVRAFVLEKAQPNNNFIFQMFFIHYNYNYNYNKPEAFRDAKFLICSQLPTFYHA